MIRRTASIVLLASTLLGNALAGASAHAASLTKTYTNTRYGISLRYPATWVARLHIKSSGLAATLTATEDGLLSPDGNIGVVLFVQERKLQTAALKATALKLFRDGETVIGPVRTGTMIIGHTTFLRWSGTTRDDVGSQSETLLVGVAAKGTYYFGVFVDGTVKDQAAAMTTLQRVLQSITIK